MPLPDRSSPLQHRVSGTNGVLHAGFPDEYPPKQQNLRYRFRMPSQQLIAMTFGVAFIPGSGDLQRQDGDTTIRIIPLREMWPSGRSA